jgi:hypothetical protein
LKWLVNFYAQVLYWLLFILTGKKHYKTVIVDNPPTDVASNVVYIIGEKNYFWCAMMECPCGCEDLIHLNLIPEGHPKWSYSIHKSRTVSFHPSIWRIKGCKSHFFFKKGLVEWCK